jgi:hypothetical protein
VESLSDAFPGIPVNQSDSDVDLGRAMWTVWKDNQVRERGSLLKNRAQN